jgi:plastocyanin
MGATARTVTHSVTDGRSRYLSRRLRIASIGFLAALWFALPGTAQAQELQAHVGLATNPDAFSIALTNADGSAVTHLDPGTYTIVVHDYSEMHDFHLTGPGVNVATAVERIETVTWTVTLTDGTYRFVCDPHASTMRGSFTVGTPPATPKPKRLTATVGPGFTISLKTAGGVKVKSLAAGIYLITVRDRSNKHNFHLTGPGVNKATGVAFRGTITWRVTFRKGKTYRFRCDPHRRNMKGSFRAT